MGRAFFFLVLLLFFVTTAEAIDISATGGWGETIDQADLVSGAGSDLVDTYESATDATSIDITNTIDKHDAWRVDVRRVDGGGWHGDFTLYVKRTSDGNGQGNVISGGLSYIEITTTDSEFYSGEGALWNVDVQYQLTGMSIGVLPANYSTTIIFTVVDI
ncbi:MAG: hypothetical protein AMJ91_03250 [candidate division Zixibacteria bacterium SM23_73_3]|nr:MAG: hypothetical protein AMJ91_03250 [candidate division Zixibacteria bacterium SM23_73_3]